MAILRGTTPSEAGSAKAGMMLGGIILSALAISPADYTTNIDDKYMPMQKIPSTAPPPLMYLEDRIIPEQFAT